MTTPTFLDRLHAGAPLLADGAMGTRLHGRGLPMDACFDRYNLTQPDLIYDIHRGYLEVGAEIIETNTFGSNRHKLAEHGLEDQVEAIIRAGVALARRAVVESQRAAFVAGAVGPLGAGIQPFGRMSRDEALAIFTEQMTALVGADPSQGVDVIALETFTDLSEILIAIDAARAVAPGVPLIAQMTFSQDDRTLSGHLPGAVVRALYDAGAEVIGVNCSGGPAQISRILNAMRTAEPRARLSAMPNAGFPEAIAGRMMYPATEDYFADYALTFKALGACVIGGCCGTTERHIEAMRAALDDPTRALPVISLSEPGVDDERRAAERPTELAFKLASGDFLISVEMNPPRSHNIERMVSSAVLLRDAGADVLNIADSPTARMRLSPWAASSALQGRIGVETILHFPTRGRNLLRIQGDLLGAHALNIRNVFVVMGDPTRIGDYPDAMDTYDIVPSALIALIKQRMNAGVDQAGNSLGQPTSFTVGCALNMGAGDVDKEITTLIKKIDSGADFALAQPSFDPAAVEGFLRRYEAMTGSTLRLPVLMGVTPLYSAKHAAFLHNEVPGITISDTIRDRVAAAGEDAAQEGVRIAQQLMRDLRDLVQGAYIIPAYGRYELAAQVVDSVRARA